jgi:hypothetical protein
LSTYTHQTAPSELVEANRVRFSCRGSGETPSTFQKPAASATAKILSTRFMRVRVAFQADEKRNDSRKIQSARVPCNPITLWNAKLQETRMRSFKTVRYWRSQDTF